MLTISYLLGLMVLFGMVLGIVDLIRDLNLDRQNYRDWQNLYAWETNGWDIAPVSRELDPIDWFFIDDALGIIAYQPVVVEDIKVPMFFGFNKQQMEKLLSDVADMSEEDSLEPIIIDITSSIHNELRNERLAESYRWRSGSQEGYADVI